MKFSPPRLKCMESHILSLNLAVGFFFRLLFHNGHTIQASNDVCWRGLPCAFLPNISTRSPPCPQPRTWCRAGQRLVSTADELKISSGSRPVRGPGRVSAVFCVSTGSRSLFIRWSSLLKPGTDCAASAALKFRKRL